MIVDMYYAFIVNPVAKSLFVTSASSGNHGVVSVVDAIPGVIVIVIVALFPFTVAVIVAVPSATPVTKPESLTVAFVVSALLYVIVPAALDG